MADKNNMQKDTPKGKLNPLTLLAFSTLGIFLVLLIANRHSIGEMLDTVNSVLAPITIGFILAYIANPFLRFFEFRVFNKTKKRVNRALSMIMTYILLLAILAGMVWLVAPQVVSSVRDLSTNGMIYISRVITTINDLITALPFLPVGDGAELLTLEKMLAAVINFVSDSSSIILNNVGTIASGALTALKNVVVGVFVSIYVLLSKDRLNAGCRRIFRAFLSRKNEKLLLTYIGSAHSKFGGYLVGKMVDSLMVGILCGIMFSVFKIPYAILIAVIIGVTDFIPFFGPFIGAIPSAVIIFIASPMKSVLFVILILIVQQIDGNLIAPIIIGDRTGLTSLGVIVAITVMGGLFGFAGLLIGVPLFAVAVAVLDDYVKHRLKQKGAKTNLYDYYPADAFLTPEEETVHGETLTQKLVRWIRAVETEVEGVDYKPTKWHAFHSSLRRGLLVVGRGLGRIFSTKPIPEDHQNSIYRDIATHGMRTRRSMILSVILTVLSAGIYQLYLVQVVSQCTNLACHKDKKRTWGFFPYLFLCIVTIGVFPILWHYQVINRWEEYFAERDMELGLDAKEFLKWSLIIIVGPFVALTKFLHTFNRVCAVFNSEHTFPLAKPPVTHYEETAPADEDESLPTEQ